MKKKPNRKKKLKRILKAGKKSSHKSFHKSFRRRSKSANQFGRLRARERIKNMYKLIKPRNKDTILVLDFGSQYTQVVARRIREKKVYTRINFIFPNSSGN